MIYPHFDTLNTAPDFLTFGERAMHALEQAGYIAPSVRHLSPDARRAYDRRTRKAWAGRAKRGLGGKRVA